MSLGVDSLKSLSERVEHSLVGLVAGFKKEGKRLYLVGGVVRDALLDIPINDIDLTTDAEPKLIKKLLSREAEAMWFQGERFGTVGARVGGLNLEITTHRREVYNSATRNPSVCFGDNIIEDLSRRDFTINAMAVELPSFELIDPFAGQNDLAQRVLATPLDPAVSFSDDPLRLLRAARFIARFNLKARPVLFEAVVQQVERLQIVSAERIRSELELLLQLTDPTTGLTFMLDTALLARVIPALQQLSYKSLEATVQSATLEASPLVRRALLLWPLRSRSADCHSSLADLRYSNSDRRATLSLLEALKMAEGWDSSRAVLRSAVVTVGAEKIADLKQASINLGFDQFADGLDSLAAAEDLSDLSSALSGAEIMAVLGLEPGPIVGRAQRFLQQYRLENGPLDHDRAVRVISQWYIDQS